MIDFVTYLVKNLVDFAEHVTVDLEEIVSEKDGKPTSLVKILVHKKDLGHVIGKKGSTINSLRTLALIIGAREDKRVRVEVDAHDE